MTKTLKTLPKKPFYFIRHGQTNWNKEHRSQGQTDIPLNETGIAQAKEAAKNITHIGFSHIVCSPLQRAMQTATIIANTTNKPITIIDELKECSWGIMEGQHKGDGKWLDNWQQGGFIEKAERWQDFVERVASGLAIALKDNGPVLIVAHGGIYWAIQEILQLASEGDIPNCQPVFHQPLHPDGIWIAEEIQTLTSQQF